MEMQILALGGRFVFFHCPNLFPTFLITLFCEDKECQDTLFTGLPLPKLVTFLMQTVLKYNKQLRTIGEHFGGHMKSYMLMTKKSGVVFVNMKLNFVFTLLH